MDESARVLMQVMSEVEMMLDSANDWLCDREKLALVARSMERPHLWRMRPPEPEAAPSDEADDLLAGIWERLERARDLAIAAGVPAERLHSVRAPHLDTTVEHREKIQRARWWHARSCMELVKASLPLPWSTATRAAMQKLAIAEGAMIDPGQLRPRIARVSGTTWALLGMIAIVVVALAVALAFA